MSQIVFDIAKDFGIFDQVKNKLIKQPDPALKHLTDVIEEIYKTYCALDSELTNYLSIWFDMNDPATIANNRRTLIGLEGGSVRVRMAQSRGHCSKIKPIYERYLNPWFFKTLDNQEFSEIENIFTTLIMGDSDIIEAIDRLAEWLEDRAHLILDMVGQGNYFEANREIENDRVNTHVSRIDLSKALRTLYQIHAELIDVTGAI